MFIVAALNRAKEMAGLQMLRNASKHLWLFQFIIEASVPCHCIFLIAAGGKVSLELVLPFFRLHALQRNPPCGAFEVCDRNTTMPLANDSLHKQLMTSWNAGNMLNMRTQLVNHLGYLV